MPKRQTVVFSYANLVIFPSSHYPFHHFSFRFPFDLRISPILSVCLLQQMFSFSLTNLLPLLISNQFHILLFLPLAIGYSILLFFHSTFKNVQYLPNDQTQKQGQIRKESINIHIFSENSYNNKIQQYIPLNFIELIQKFGNGGKYHESFSQLRFPQAFL